MKAKYKSIIILTVLLMLLTSCNTISTEGNETPTIGSTLTVEIKSISESYIDSMVTAEMKQFVKDKSTDKIFDGIRRDNWKFEDEMLPYSEEAIGKALTDAFTEKGYEIVSEFKSRFLVEGTVNIRYGYDESGAMAVYDATFKVTDNNVHINDPSRDVSLISYQKGVSGVTDIDTINHHASPTWATNGSIHAENHEAAVEAAIENIAYAVKNDFTKNMI